MSDKPLSTVRLPRRLIASIDQLGVDRQEFVAQAVREALARATGPGDIGVPAEAEREHLAIEQEGFEDWVAGLPDEDTNGLVDMSKAVPLAWVPGKGLVEQEP